MLSAKRRPSGGDVSRGGRVQRDAALIEGNHVSTKHGGGQDRSYPLQLRSGRVFIHIANPSTLLP